MIKRSLFSRRRFPLLLLSCALATPFISQGFDMFGWFKKQEVFLSSEVNGVVTENGEAVANLEVIRSLMYIDGKDHVDVSITDSTGHFYFPQKSIRSSIPSKPFSEDRVSQQIFITKDDKTIPFWGATQRGYHEIIEFTEKLTLLNCELTNKRVDFEFKNKNNEHLNHTATSICRWNEDYVPVWLYDGDKEYRIYDGNFNKLEERNLKGI